jgi:3',5'-nucleoside bisphosphate phosphatase
MGNGDRETGIGSSPFPRLPPRVPRLPSPVSLEIMIDLHMHTTASDGTSTPEDLVARVHRAGITVFSVTDHDTMASVAKATALAAEHGVTCVPGIEITSVQDGHDVHMLGYFLDAGSVELDALLARIRALRVERAEEISSRLAAAGAPIDVDALIGGAHPQSSKSIARPQIARALIAAGHVATVSEAFDRYLSEGCCAYVPHRGPSPQEAIRVVGEAGGIASLAHPGTANRDEIVPALVDAGLAAIEAYHSAHDEAATARYLAMAKAHGVGVSGGSDFHGEGTRRSEFFGVVTLPSDEFDRLASRVSAAVRPHK